VVSCENEAKLMVQKIETSNRDKYRCMFLNSVSKSNWQTQFAGQINGKFQTVLLNAVVENAEIGQHHSAEIY
jgi:hypothetical protein